MLLKSLQAANLAIRFLLELCLLAALAFWGAHAGSAPLVTLALAVGAPVLAALLWGTFLAPKAARPLASPARLAVEVILFGLAALGLTQTHHPILAGALLLIFVLNRALLYLWRQ